MTGWKQGLVLLGLAAAALAGGCGAGVAGVVASTGGGGSSNAPPGISGFQVVSPKAPPARLLFTLADPEGQPATVEFLAEVDGGPRERLTEVMDLAANPATLATSRDGTAYDLTWNFSAESFLPHDARFVPDVTVIALLAGSTEVVLGANAVQLGMGNDAPLVTAIEPVTGEPSGIVGIELRVEDSSDDVVSVRVEYDLAGDVPDAGFRLARPALAEATPDFGIENVQVDDLGTTLSFFWDTNVDLADLERDVVLRFTAKDEIVEGASRTSNGFHVDNNAAPIVQLQNDFVVLNPDERRGIPIPFRVIDEEEDLVEVILQWRHEDVPFPDLPGDKAALDAILGDPLLRREHHVCTPYPRHARGRVVPAGASSVRLPELAAGESWILAAGLEGRSLELMRPVSIPQPITPTWAANPLVAPVAALALGDGRTALVLDASGGSGRLREIELASGGVVREIATLESGTPTAMAFDHDGERAVIVASDLGIVWRLERVELASGVVTELYTSTAPDEPPPVRGVASIGSRALVLTAGSSLLHLDFQDPIAPRLVTIFRGLAAPWGVVVDPRGTHRLHLAERDADRVLTIELDSRHRLPVVVNIASLTSIVGPRSLALEDRGTRLLAVTTNSAGSFQLVGLDLGAQGRNEAFPIGSPSPNEIDSIATGPDDLRIAAQARAHELLVGGGLEQRRTIVAYEHFDAAGRRGQTATIDVPFQPEARPGQVWRVPAFERIPAAAGGRVGSFLWNSGIDAAAGGPVFLRALARDEELGPAVDGAAPKSLRAALDVEPLAVGGFPNNRPVFVAAADLDGDGDLDLVSDDLVVSFQTSPGIFVDTPLALGRRSVFVVAADLDGDGDLDVVSANGDLSIYFQTSPGSFTSTPLTLGGSSITDAVSVAAADLDGDGDLDLVSATDFGRSLTVFFQISPGSFADTPLVLGGPATTDRPVFVAPADLDGDGDLDLVSANQDGNDLTVFFQSSPGSFADTPLVLGDFPITRRPVSVAAADLDGDGDLDLVSANADSDDLTAFFQTSPGSFTDTPLVLGDSSITDGPSSVVAADLDGDGDLDVVSANQLGDDFTIFFQTSPGTFADAPRALGGPGITDSPDSIAAADLDGDGDLDLCSANAGPFRKTGNLTVFFQTALGTFADAPLTLGRPSTGPPIIERPRSVAAADLDGDGDLDLVSANEDSSNLTVFFQTSPGSFVDPPLLLGGFASTTLPSSAGAADLDDDGDLDVVSANSEDLTVFFQSSPGSFASTPLLLGGPLTMGRPNSVAAADLDGDGDLDLLSANSAFGAQGDNLTVFFQASPGSFASTPLPVGGPSTTEGPNSVAAADLDDDGDLDLVSSNATDLTVFFQGPAGSFPSTPLALGGSGITSPRSVTAGDLDGDGDLDLVSANQGGLNLRAFFQLSPGRFNGNPLTLEDSATANALSVAAADLDGDGDLDLVSANGLDDNLTVLWGGR